MNKSKKHVSKRTLALITAAVLLFASGGILGTRAALNITSDDLETDFVLDHVGVQLLEAHDGAYQRVGKEGESGGELIAYMKTKPSDEVGHIVPGNLYDEHVAALNETGTEGVSPVDQYVRIVVRKYWADKNGKKDNTRDPSLIKLTYGSQDYNQGPWQKNEKESTVECETYYYTSVLKAQQQTPDLFNQLQLDAKVKDDVTVTESDWVISGDKKKKKYTYTYAYSGLRVCVEAEAQALQTHSINRAIKSVWGVQNVSASGGTLTVGQ